MQHSEGKALTPLAPDRARLGARPPTPLCEPRPQGSSVSGTLSPSPGQGQAVHRHRAGAPASPSLENPILAGSRRSSYPSGNVKPGPCRCSNDPTRPVGTTATRAHPPATPSPAAGLSVAGHGLGGRVRIGLLAPRSLCQLPPTLGEEVRRGKTQKTKVWGAWRKRRQRLTAPRSRARDGGLREDRPELQLPAAVGPGRQGPQRGQGRRSRKQWWWWARGQCGQRGTQPGPAPGTKRLPGSGESALPLRCEGGTGPARPGAQGGDARQLASGRGRGGGRPGQGIQSLPSRGGGTRFPGQQLTSQPARPQPTLLLPTPLQPQARPRLPPPPSPGRAPSWALGARVTVSGLAGPSSGLCQLAVAAATSHYLAQPAREGY